MSMFGRFGIDGIKHRRCLGRSRRASRSCRLTRNAGQGKAEVTWAAARTSPTRRSAGRSRPWRPMAFRRPTSPVVGVDPKTLRKHYRDELDLGETKANAQVAGFLFNSATQRQRHGADLLAQDPGPVARDAGGAAGIRAPGAMIGNWRLTACPAFFRISARATPPLAKIRRALAEPARPAHPASV